LLFPPPFVIPAKAGIQTRREAGIQTRQSIKRGGVDVSKQNWSVMFLLTVLVFGLWANNAESSVVLRAVVVNPSRTKTQDTVLKAYLPEEVKPDDVLDMDDLAIDYDIEKQLYYVYKQFELAPGESVTRSVKIKNVWIISQAELESLVSKAKGLLENLANTSYANAARSLWEDIIYNMDEILKRQEQAADEVPQTLIAVYRENVVKLNLIKGHLTKLDNMLLEERLSPPPAADVMIGRISVEKSWAVILGVIVSLGILSLIFFIIWHKQAGILQPRKQDGSPDDELDA
jgi:hypothetical protein